MPETAIPIRPLTARALRRSWNEPSVRGWWLTSLGILLVVLWIVIEQLSVARRGQYRVDHWTHIDNAVIEKIAGETRKSYRVSPEQLATYPVKVAYTDAAGKSHELDGLLQAQREPVSPGKPIPILIDPANPENWTDRVKPVPLIEELMAVMLFLPLILLFGGVTLWQRRRILNLWQNGTQHEAMVTARTHSATSPRSSILRCTIEDGRTKRLLRVAIPNAAARLDVGDTLPVIAAEGESTRAIAVVLYE